MNMFRCCQHYTKYSLNTWFFNNKELDSIATSIKWPKPTKPSIQRKASKDKYLSICLLPTLVLFRGQGLFKMQTLREITMCWLSPFSSRQKVITKSVSALYVSMSDSENSVSTMTANCSHQPLETFFSDRPSALAQWSDAHISWATL